MKKPILGQDCCQKTHPKYLTAIIDKNLNISNTFQIKSCQCTDK